MALEFISHSDARFDLQRLIQFIGAYQSVAPLTLGELWAWPSMLKLCLIENIRRLAGDIMESREGEADADRYFAQFETLNPADPLPPLPEALPNGFVVQLVSVCAAGTAHRATDRDGPPARSRGTQRRRAVRADTSRRWDRPRWESITALRLVATTDWNRTSSR